MMLGRLGLGLLTTLLCTSAMGQNMCDIAAKYIPYIETSAFDHEQVNQSVWQASCDEKFTERENFRSWSSSTDASASYKLFSASYGDASAEESRDFATSYALFCSNFQSTYIKYKANSATRTAPSEAYIERVLAECAKPGGLYVRVTPSTDNPDKFFARIAIRDSGTTPTLGYWLETTNAECVRETNSTNPIVLTKFVTTLDQDFNISCERTDSESPTVGFASSVGEAREYRLATAGELERQTDKLLAQLISQKDKQSLSLKALGEELKDLRIRHDNLVARYNDDVPGLSDAVAEAVPYGGKVVLHNERWDKCIDARSQSNGKVIQGRPCGTPGAVDEQVFTVKSTRP